MLFFAKIRLASGMIMSDRLYATSLEDLTARLTSKYGSFSYIDAYQASFGKWITLI